MDARELQFFKDEVTKQLYRYIDSRLSGGSTEPLNADVAIAIKQLGYSLTVLRESWSATSMIVSTIQSELNDIKTSISELKKSTSDTSMATRVDILNASFLKMQADINILPIKEAIASLEKTTSTLVLKISGMSFASRVDSVSSPSYTSTLESQVATMIEMASKLRPFDSSNIEARLARLESSTSLGSTIPTPTVVSMEEVDVESVPLSIT